MHPSRILSLLALAATTVTALPFSAATHADSSAALTARDEGYGYGEDANGDILDPLDRRDGEEYGYGEDANGDILVPFDKREAEEYGYGEDANGNILDPLDKREEK